MNDLTTEAVISGLKAMVVLSLSTQEYISLETISVFSPIPLLNKPASSIIGVLISLYPKSEAFLWIIFSSLCQSFELSGNTS